MKPSPRFSVLLRTLLVCSALLKISQAECVYESTCNSTEPERITTTTTSVTFESMSDCSVSIENTTRDSPIHDLTPGTVYEISFNCFSCCRNVTTKPAKITNLIVNGTTTSSIYLMWTKPEGSTSFYKVQWVGKVAIVNETRVNVTGLMAGVQYNITVTAVAEDGETEGENVTVSWYTRPGQIGEPTVSTNTTSISISWMAPPGEVFQYRVGWHDGGAPVHKNTSATSAVLTDLIPGTSYTITVTAFARDGLAGDPYIFTSVTNPAVVSDLTITDITTSSVSLSWTEPEGNASSYTIHWTREGVILNNNTIETSFTIPNLTPGYQYNITVTAVASIKEGEGISITTSTKPVKPEDIQVIARGTDMLGINWTLPEGGFDHFQVNISSEGHFNSSKTKQTTVHFTGLNPGRIFNVTVTAVVGSFSNTSDQSQFATNPTPPGPIIISQRTNSSLHLKWDTPALMAGAISYYITYQPEGGGVLTHSASVNDAELNLLSSGTSYNITLQTVGPQNLMSTIVHNAAFTLPNPVLNLIANPKSTTSVTVRWSYPQGVQPYYEYLVQIYNDTGPLFNRTVNSSSSTDVPNLEPGTKYTINVTTRAAPESESMAEQTFSYTMPQAVTDLTVEGENTTAIRLTWVRQPDHKPSYSYLVIALLNDIMVQNQSTEAETYTFIQLTPGELYTFQVFTVVAGVRSTVESKSSYTQPDTVSDITVVGDTTSLSVSWISGTGHVDSYSVLLYRDSQLVQSSTDLSNTTFNKLFQGLKPGVLYCALVATKSGGFETNSSNVCNATFPNPPGPIMVDSQTVESINFTWPRPEDMDHNQYRFGVYNHEGFNLTENNWFLLTKLQSGSPYNISVVTVGERDFMSTAVTAENYTRPYNVSMLGQKEITTHSVTLVWEQLDSKPGYSYVVHVSNGSFSTPEVVLNTTDTITGLLSGSNYSFTVTTQTADSTQAAPVTVSIYTRPYSITQLKADTLNTTAIHLRWAEPLEYKNEYTYQVDATGCGTQNETVESEDAQISGLTPGTECTFCVFVRAADGTKGEKNCTSQYTMPEPVHPSISSLGSNNSILVWWTKPLGGVESYKVLLDTALEQDLDSSETSHQFEDLSAGRLYTAVVITKSGPFNASSVPITNATFPNRPGPIEIVKKDTTSIDFEWQEAPLMANESFQYLVNITSPQGGEYIPSSETSHIFTNLLSGTSFTISVATVGARDLESEAQILIFTTQPFHVSELNTSPKEERITVMWDKPLEYKTSYRYNVTWQTSTGVKSNLTGETKYDIQGLVPGSHYNLSVTTETSDGTQGAAEWISGCTNASQVKDLQCIGPNKANAEVILSWNRPNGQYSGFQVSVNNSENINISTCCNHTVPNLRYYTEYTLTVKTLSCGLPSTGVVRNCRTGITDPPIPPTSLVKTAKTEYDSFSVEIDSELLNNTNGPITHVGVLVTAKQLDNTVDLRSYLGITYNQWKAGEADAYLATVTENEHFSRSGENTLIIEVGDKSTWEGYTNGVLDQGTYRYAVVSFTHLSLQDDLVSGSLSLVSTSAFITVTLPINPAIGIAVGASLGIFAVLFAILIGFIIYWKRLSNKEAPDIQIHSMRAKVSVAVRVEDYEAYYKKQKADSNCGFAEEFEDLKVVGTGQSKTNALTLDNKPKNRYNNVLPYDSSRVKLSIIHGSPYDDYINANYMPGYNSRKEFIAAQGPLPATVNEFWRMIWEKNVQTLVMLTRCNEQGRVKCERYWDSGTKHFENITVTTTSEIPLEDWTIRDFDVKNVKTAETRSVRHFHFTAWPDHGVPETTELLISFRHLVREHMDQYSRNSPTVVHCSAGVGRTGTFIAIDRLIFQIERENIVDVYGIVHDLRMHRPLMVQTEDQYVFLNQCAMDIIRSRTGTNVDLIYQNTAALSIYENVEPKRGYPKNGYHNA